MKTNKSFITRVIILSISLSIVACMAPVEKPAEWSSASGTVRPGPNTGKAVLALLSQARLASTKGALTQAESYLERALRIEPRNPALWLYMAKLRLYASKYNEALGLAKKSLALSSTGSSSLSLSGSFGSASGGEMGEEKIQSIRAESWRVIAHAYQKLGNAREAQKAQIKADSITH